MHRHAFVVYIFFCLGAMFFVYSLGIHPQTAKVFFLDVGQGDSILIESANGNQVLLDSGRGSKVLDELGAVMSFGDKHIDMIMASHYDSDHIGGFSSVLSEYSVDTLVVNGAEAKTKIALALLQKAQLHEVSMLTAQRGMKITLGSDVYLEILYPDRTPVPAGNEGSIVAQVHTPQGVFMLTGDATEKVERIVERLDGEKLQSDVLKLGHHGSKTSSSLVFLRMVQPALAVISAGLDNQYGHPHPDVLERLRSLGISFLATYRDGRIVF